ncbi:Glycosyltransferase-like 1B [Sparganum proliferum]
MPYGCLRSVCNSNSNGSEKTAHGFRDIVHVQEISPKFGVGWISSLASFAQVLVGEVERPAIYSKLPPKVLVLDTDVIFLDDISELWNFIYKADENQAISMAKDESYLYAIKIHTRRTKVLRGGYNGGVLLLNLDRLRQRGWTDLWRCALDALLKVSRVLRAAEQDIFNVAIWMHKDLFYPLPCEWNVQLNDAASMTACPNSRSREDYWSDKRPHVKLLHMNREDKSEYTDDEKLTSADVPATETSIDDRLRWYLVERKRVTLLNGYSFVDTMTQLSRGELEQVPYACITLLEELSKRWNGPISVAVCASDRQAFRLPLLLKMSSVLAERKNISYHIVYRYDNECPASFGHNAAVAFSSTSHVLLLNYGNHEIDQGIFSAVENFFRLLRRASAVISPAKISLVPPEASADGFFDFLVWNLLSAHSDAFTVVPVGINLDDNAR